MEVQGKTLPKKGARNILITSALPYVNNVPHLGNIVGSVLSADVFSRYNKARGRPTLYICGTDEFGTATETKALEEGVSPKELCDKYAKIHAEIYEWFEIGFDIFGRTSTKQQEAITQDIFRKLYKNGYTIQRTSRQPYCEKHKAFLADRYIEGTCPKCGYEDARGDQCDKCGSVDYVPLDLLNARCKIDPDVTPVARDTKHIHLLLDKLQPRIEEWVKKSSEEGAWSKNGRIITESWLKQGLRDRGITRDLKWGVPIPLDVFDNEEDKQVYKDKVFYVWFDACIGYVSITANYTEDWEKWWRDPENVQLYQFMGKDNVPFHTVIFPGCQMGTEDTWVKLHHLSTTEYLNYENGKFSKSRGVGVFGNNAKDTGVPADVWRYYLLKNRPETGDTQFEWKYFIEQNNSELLAKLGNFVNRVIKLVNSKIYNSIIPDYTKMHSDPIFDKAKDEVNMHLKQYLEELEAVNLRAGLQSAMNIAQAGNSFLQAQGFDNKLAANEPEKAGAVTGIAINLILLCASVFAPYLPATSASILEQLQAPFLYIPDHWTADDIKPGHEIGKAKYLFTLIDPKKEEEWRAMFGGTQAERLKKEEETAKAAAKKAAAKAKRAEKKAGKKENEATNVEASATGGAAPVEPGREPVDAVTDGVQQVTLPSSVPLHPREPEPILPLLWVVHLGILRFQLLETSKMQKIRVVGVGAFGSFVGDEFHRNGHEVIGYDDANPHAASRGVSVRTIRGDYADPEELEIARKCRDEWKEKHGSNFYADGRFVVYRPDDDFIEHINEARARLKLVPRIINSPEAVKKLERLYGPAVVPENGKLVLNEDDGLIDLEKAIQRAGESITRRPGVQRLIYSADSKKITGLELVGGITDDTNEDFVVLTAGVWTLKLLRDAKIPYLGELPRIVGLFSFPVFLTEEHASKLRREPALSVIGDGQFTVSLGKDPKGWVTWVKRPFRVHDLSNQTGYSSTNLATRAKMEVWEWLQSFPDFREAQIGHPIYNFDGVTSDQHHQVFRLKDRDGDIDLNAIVATNGSWHGAKKSPEIARQVTHVYRGEKSIYGCGERTRHPHQPRLFENEYFPDLETRACTVEHVEELRPYVHQRWAVFDDISELKKRLKTDTI